jgi:hypothetical protein
MNVEKKQNNIVIVVLSTALIISLIYSYSYYLQYHSEKNMREMEQKNCDSTHDFLLEEYEKIEQRLTTLESHFILIKRK